MITTRTLTACETRLLDIAEHNRHGQVVACGLVEVRAAQRFVEWGWATVVRDGGNDINGSITSLTIRLTS